MKLLCKSYGDGEEPLKAVPEVENKKMQKVLSAIKLNTKEVRMV